MPKKQTKQQCINHPDVESIFDSLCKECIQEFADQGNQVYREYLQTIKEMEAAQKKKKKKKHVEGPDFFEFLADAVQQKLNLWFSGTDDFYYYEQSSGLWRSHADIAVKSILTDIRRGMKSDEDSHKKEKITTIFKEVIAVLKGRLAPKMQSMPVPDKRYIPLGNGIFDLETEELLPYTKNFFFTTKIPWNYNPESKCDRFSEMMDDWYTREKVITGWEIMALCLFRGYPIHKFFIIYSPGGEGKSTFFNILTALLDEKNVSQVKINELSKQFESINLFRKFANIADELPPDKITDTGMLKQSTGNSMIGAARKFKSKLSFKSYATMIFSLNAKDGRPPTTDDETDGFYRRLCMLKFNGVAEDRKISGIDELIANNQDEMEGILYKTITELIRLKNSGWKMTYRESTEETRKKHMDASNPFRVFVDDFCTIADDEETTKAMFTKSLNQYLDTINRDYYKTKALYNEMTAIGIMGDRQTEFIQNQHGGGSYKKISYWTGIKINYSKLNEFIAGKKQSQEIADHGLDKLQIVQNLKSEIKRMLKIAPGLNAVQLSKMTKCSDVDLVAELLNELNPSPENDQLPLNSTPF